MPRPRHPIREHFTEVPGSDRKNGAISCNYCSKEQSAGNPKRCQKHLDECPQYTRFLESLDAGGTPPFPYQSPYDDQPPDTRTQNGNPSYGAANAAAGSFSTPQSNHTASAQSPLAGHERMDEAQIKRVLNLDDKAYLAIERELDGQMMMLNISGAGLLTQGGQTLLKQAFFHVNSAEAFSPFLSPVPEQDRSSALTSMAYIANRKRRNGHPPSSVVPQSNYQRKPPPPSTSTVSGVSIISDMSQQPPARLVSREPAGPFGLTTIIAERAEGDGAFVICRPGDLVEHSKPAEDITVNDVKFMPFIQLLQHDDDVMFNAADDDRIVHTFTGGRTKTVSNEVVWRVALEEMHKNGSNPFVFKIYKRRPGMPV